MLLKCSFHSFQREEAYSNDTDKDATQSQIPRSTVSQYHASTQTSFSYPFKCNASSVTSGCRMFEPTHKVYSNVLQPMHRRALVCHDRYAVGNYSASSNPVLPNLLITQHTFIAIVAVISRKGSVNASQYKMRYREELRFDVGSSSSFSFSSDATISLNERNCETASPT